MQECGKTHRERDIMNIDESIDPQEKIKVISPHCRVYLRGVTRGMIGDTGVCTKCKGEFTIEEIRSDPARLKRKAKIQIRVGICTGILFAFWFSLRAIASTDYLDLIPVALVFLYLSSIYMRWFCVNVVLYGLFVGMFVRAAVISMYHPAAEYPIWRFCCVFWPAVLSCVFLCPILGMLNEKKAAKEQILHQAPFSREESK